MELRSKQRSVLLLALVALAMLVGGAALLQVGLMLRPVTPGVQAPRIVEIPQGATAARVAELLLSNGVIRNAFVFRLLAEYRGLDGRIRAGEYELNPAMSAGEILEHLVRGPIVTHPFTVREGLTVSQTADVLASQGIVDRDRFLKAARDPSVASKLLGGLLPAGADLKEPLEGYLFPETYRVRKGATEAEIVAMMVQRFLETFDAALRERAAELDMTVHEVVTLASIIEKEAVVDEERAIISGVFHNRLRARMKLDADPTVRYATGKYTGPVTIADTQVKSPYNTYREPGLPPGPIAAPGLASIRAALYPASTKYYYFVARNDGTHQFSTTLRDHINAVRRYRPYGL